MTRMSAVVSAGTIAFVSMFFAVRAGATPVSCAPSVEGPIPVTNDSHPYVPTALQGPIPVPRGYVTEEFFVSCTALGQPYRTRLFVRRPEHRGRFSGTVITEVPDGPIWTTIIQTAGYQIDAGHVSVIVESVPAFLNAFVKPFDPARYANLSIPNVPGINFEIEAQVGALLKSRARGPLLAGFDVRHVIFTGYSGSSAEVRRYIANAHNQIRLADGGPIYDGFFPQQTAVGQALTPIPDLDVPVIEIQGEREVISTFIRVGSLTYRRSDGPLYRLYEVPGQPHLSTRTGEIGPFYSNWVCVSPAGSFVTTNPTLATQFPHEFIDNMGLRNLVDWVVRGIPAPHAERIALEADGRTVARDAFGNAVGGVRSSYVDVPIASYAAISTNDPAVNQPDARCDFIGYQLRFSEDELRRLYGDHGGYVSRIARRLEELVAQSWIRADDARTLLIEAAQADVL